MLCENLPAIHLVSVQISSEPSAIFVEVSIHELNNKKFMNGESTLHLVRRLPHPPIYGFEMPRPAWPPFHAALSSSSSMPRVCPRAHAKVSSD
jgi:hypothetical protein